MNEAFESGFQGGIGAAKKKKGGPKTASMPAFKNGGKVKKTGPALVHKGELVLTAQEAKGRSKKSSKKHSRKKVSTKR